MNITIQNREIAELLLKNVKHFGNPDWAIYTNIDGVLDVRHNNESMSGWIEIFSFYGMDDYPSTEVDLSSLDGGFTSNVDDMIHFVKDNVDHSLEIFDNESDVEIQINFR